MILDRGGNATLRGAPSTVTGGSTILKLIWGGNCFFPGFGDLEPYESWKFRIRSQSVSRVFPDLTPEMLHRTRGTSKTHDHSRLPLTLQPLLFGKKQARGSPKKARVFLFAEPLKSLEKKGETHKAHKKAVAVSKEKNPSSVPEGAANFPAAVFLAGKCPNLGRDSMSCCQKIGENCPAALNFARKLFQQGISESHSLLEFS